MGEVIAEGDPESGEGVESSLGRGAEVKAALPLSPRETLGVLLRKVLGVPLCALGVAESRSVAAAEGEAQPEELAEREGAGEEVEVGGGGGLRDSEAEGGAEAEGAEEREGTWEREGGGVVVSVAVASALGDEEGEAREPLAAGEAEEELDTNMLGTPQEALEEGVPPPPYWVAEGNTVAELQQELNGDGVAVPLNVCELLEEGEGVPEKEDIAEGALLVMVGVRESDLVTTVVSEGDDEKVCWELPVPVSNGEPEAEGDPVLEDMPELEAEEVPFAGVLVEQAVAVSETVAEGEAVAVRMGLPEGVALALPDRVTSATVADAVCVGTATVAVAFIAVALTDRETEGEVEPERVRRGDEEMEAVAAEVAEGKAGEALGEAVAAASVAVANRSGVPVGKAVKVPVDVAKSKGVPVGKMVGVFEAVAKRNGVPVGDTDTRLVAEGKIDCEVVGQALIEVQGEGERE